jgi:hypothetical protein
MQRKAQFEQRPGQSMRPRNRVTLSRAAESSDSRLARKNKPMLRAAMEVTEKVTICPSGSNGTILGFVAVTRSDCSASLGISITEKTTFVHRELHDDYTTFSCAWVRPWRMRDCSENSEDTREIHHSFTLSERRQRRFSCARVRAPRMRYCREIRCRTRYVGWIIFSSGGRLQPARNTKTAMRPSPRA